MHNRNGGEELANRVQPEVPPTTQVEPDVCLKVPGNLIPLCANDRLQASNSADDNRHQCRIAATTTANNNNKDKQRNCCYAAEQQPLKDHAQLEVYLHRGDSDQESILLQTRTSKNSNDLKRAAVDKLHFQHSACHLDNCGVECRGDSNPTGVIPTKYQVLCGRVPSDSSSVAATVRATVEHHPHRHHHHHCLFLQHCQQQQETVVEEGFQCKFSMMNGNLHLVKSTGDARSVAMETFDSNAPCAPTTPQQQQSLGGQQPNHTHHHLVVSGKMTTADKNTLNEQQQMLEQLNGMSINERRFGFGNNGSKNGTMLLTPRITLTSADDIDDGHHCDDMMMDYELNDSEPLSPNFLAVPKLQEVGKERRPPVMVKSV